MTDTTVPSNVQPIARRAPAVDLQPKSLPEAMQLAEMLRGAEGMVPKAFLGHPGKILAVILAGQELGISTMAALRGFHVIEGKPVAEASFWIARLKAAGYQVVWLERGPEKCVLQLIDPQGNKSLPETWDKARAVTAGLWQGKDNWKKYPQNMLAARCVTSLGRSFAAEVMFGCYEVDEAEEIMRDAIVSEVRSVPPPTGASTPQLAASVAGATVTPEAQQVEQKARECADMLKQLKIDRKGLFVLLTELKIPHTEKTRLTELSLDNLVQLQKGLHAEADLRGGGPGTTSETPPMTGATEPQTGGDQPQQ